MARSNVVSRGPQSAVTGFTTENGRSLFAGERKFAYDGGGVAFDHEITDVDEMLDTAGCNFHFHMSPVFDDEGNEIPGARVNYRTITGGENDGMRKHEGIVGSRYENLDPAPALAFLQDIAGKHPFIGAGYFEKDSRLFAQMRFSKEHTIAGVGAKWEGHATVSTTFDGSGSVMVGFGPIAIDCKNVLNVAMRGMSNVIKFRHTASLTERMAQAAKVEGVGTAYFEVAAKVANDLAAAKYSDKQFDNLFLTFFPKPEAAKGPAAMTKWENRRGLYTEAWKHDSRSHIRFTAWGAWQAMTEANQWGRGIQDTDHGADNFWSAGLGFETLTNRFRQDTLACVAERAGVEV